MSQTTQKISKETLNRLKTHGKMGDTFDAVVSRVLDQVEEHER